jgi:serine/threonine protein phosphatase PrpC
MEFTKRVRDSDNEESSLNLNITISEKIAKPNKTFKVQFGSDTDIGGGHQNQDTFLIFSRPSEKLYVFAMIDGHGTELGTLAANTVRSSILDYMTHNFLEMKNNPVQTLNNIFILSHNSIKDAFKIELTRKKYNFTETSDGYLVKNGLFMSDIVGGATCSVIVIVDDIIYIANVGDSSGILFSNISCLNQQRDVHQIHDFAFPEGIKELDTNDDSTNMLFLTADHSPSNLDEIKRINKNPPEKRVILIYDQTNIIFDPSNKNATPPGGYYKNVRKEYGIIARTPLSEPNKIGLSMTRALGDFKLNCYGISHLPEIRCIKLRDIMESQKELSSLITKTETEPKNLYPLCIVLATDGVWDNWKFEDVKDCVMNDSCLKVLTESSNGAQLATESLMEINNSYGEKNFGTNTDNATCILIYISDEDNFKSIDEDTII